MIRVQKAVQIASATKQIIDQVPIIDHISGPIGGIVSMRTRLEGYVDKSIRKLRQKDSAVYDQILSSERFKIGAQNYHVTIAEQECNDRNGATNGITLRIEIWETAYYTQEKQTERVVARINLKRRRGAIELTSQLNHIIAGADLLPETLLVAAQGKTLGEVIKTRFTSFTNIASLIIDCAIQSSSDVIPVSRHLTFNLKNPS